LSTFRKGSRCPLRTPPKSPKSWKGRKKTYFSSTRYRVLAHGREDRPDTAGKKKRGKEEREREKKRFRLLPEKIQFWISEKKNSIATVSRKKPSGKDGKRRSTPCPDPRQKSRDGSARKKKTADAPNPSKKKSE